MGEKYWCFRVNILNVINNQVSSGVKVHEIEKWLLGQFRAKALLSFTEAAREQWKHALPEPWISGMVCRTCVSLKASWAKEPSERQRVLRAQFVLLGGLSSLTPACPMVIDRPLPVRLWLGATLKSAGDYRGPDWWGTTHARCTRQVPHPWLRAFARASQLFAPSRASPRGDIREVIESTQLSHRTTPSTTSEAIWTSTPIKVRGFHRTTSENPVSQSRLENF